MKKYFILLFPALLLLMGCPPEPLPPVDKGVLELNFTPYWNGAPLEFGIMQSAYLGRTMRLDSFQFYISNIRLVKNDNTEEQIGEVYLFDFLKAGKTDHGSGVFESFTINVGDYKGLIFDIGVPANLNHTNAATYNADSPLHSSKNMFWNETDGYTFLFMKGQVDSVGTILPLSYRVGLDNLRTTLNYASASKDAFSIKKNTETQFILQIDVRELLYNIDIAQNISIDSRNSQGYLLSQQILDNMKTKSLFKEP